jgi:hypothetical protein
VTYMLRWRCIPDPFLMEFALQNVGSHFNQLHFYMSPMILRQWLWFNIPQACSASPFRGSGRTCFISREVFSCAALKFKSISNIEDGFSTNQKVLL